MSIPSRAYRSTSFQARLAVWAALALLNPFMAPLLAAPPALLAIPITRLTAHDAEHGDQFGVAIAIHQQTALVGAYWDDDAGTASGGAYLFEPNEQGAWFETQKLVANDAAPNDWFGVSVAIHKNLALIGAALQDQAAPNAGAAYLFERDPLNPSQWRLLQKLTATDAHADDWFGWRVALNDELIVIGSHQNDEAGSDTGAVYVFRPRTDDSGLWEQSVKLTVPGSSPGAWLGFSLALHQNQIIAGAPFAQANGVSSGAAHIFSPDPNNQNQWRLTSLYPASPAYNQQFGWSVAVGEQIAAVGARLTSHAAPQGGAVFLFEPTQDNLWRPFQILVSDDNSTNDWFGESIALAPNLLSVGVRLDDDQGNASGAAYLFQPNALDHWRQTQKILASDGDKEFRFGESIALTEELLFVGSFADDSPGFGFASGAAYLLGLDPYNPAFTISKGANNLQINWLPSAPAVVECSTNLLNWTTLHTGLPPLTISNLTSAQFFRLRQP